MIIARLVVGTFIENHKHFDPMQALRICYWIYSGYMLIRAVYVEVF